MFQIVAMIFFTAVGDFGSWRKTLLLFSAVVGASTNFFIFAFGTPENYAFIGWLFIFGNLFFGYSIVMYNAFLPFICKDHPEVRALIEKKEKAHKVVDKYKDIQDEISNFGYLVGYISGTCLLIGCVVVLFALSGSMGPINLYCLSILLAGSWWLLFSIPTAYYLEERPGPPIPGEGTIFDLMWISISRLSESM